MFKYRISFSINYRTNYGEFLALTGSDAQLGSWNLDNSIIMKWNEVKQILFYFNINIESYLDSQNVHVSQLSA